MGPSASTDPSPAPGRRNHSARDHKDYARYKDILDQEFAAQAEHAASIHRKGLCLKEVRDRRLYEIDGFEKFGEWTDARYSIGERQAAKYISICTNLTEAQCRRFALEMEGLYEMSQAPAWLHQTLLWLLGPRGLGAAEVARGRVAGTRKKMKGASEEEACAEARRVALGAAGLGEGAEEDEKRPPQRDNSVKAQVRRLHGEVARRLAQIRKGIAKGESPPQELAEIRLMLEQATAEVVALTEQELVGPIEADFHVKEEAPPDKPGTKEAAEPPPAPPTPPQPDVTGYEPLFAAMQEAQGLHNLIKSVLFSAAVQPGDYEVWKWLKRLGRDLVRTTGLPEELYLKWARDLLVTGPDQGMLVVETLRRAGLSGYRQALERLRGAPVPERLRARVRELLLAVN